MTRLWAVSLIASLAAGCSPRVPGLEESMAGAMVTGQAGVPMGAAVPMHRVVPGANPAFDSRQRIPNTNPRVLTNNVYGPGRSSDAAGRMVFHEPGLIIEETALGQGDYTDQYGRPVRCYRSGMGTFCN